MFLFILSFITCITVLNFLFYVQILILADESVEYSAIQADSRSLATLLLIRDIQVLCGKDILYLILCHIFVNLFPITSICLMLFRYMICCRSKK